MKSRWQYRLWCWTALAALLGAVMSRAGDDQGRALLNTTPPAWQVQDWINSPPLKLAELKGKVVLVRWWTSPGCPYCASTAPALNDFHARYQKRGLVVVGLYHHKSSVPMKPDHVVQHAAKFGFQFPVATDPDWQTLNQWWLKTGDRDFTSVSFLLDQAGRIQYIHPGGEYPQGSASWKMLNGMIESLLDKP